MLRLWQKWVAVSFVWLWCVNMNFFFRKLSYGSWIFQSFFTLLRLIPDSKKLPANYTERNSSSLYRSLKCDIFFWQVLFCLQSTCVAHYLKPSLLLHCVSFFGWLQEPQSFNFVFSRAEFTYGHIMNRCWMWCVI